MTTPWMIRAGERAYLIDEFEKGLVAIGWGEMGDLTDVTDVDAIREIYLTTYPESKPGERGGAIAMVNKFRNVLEPSVSVVTYNPNTREYLVGTIKSEYLYRPDTIPDMPHLREVEWTHRVPRDDLSVAARNTLGSTLTVFSLNDDVWAELEAPGRTKGVATDDDRHDEERNDLEQIREETVAKAHELIKDRILDLTADQLEKLAAAILRAMGYRTRVSPKGPDRGSDIFASPDGLGLEEPRIRVEVKHRSGTAMGAPEVRGFLGGLRERDRGLYVSTGGFTKEAKYEADRSSIPVTLIDLDLLAELVVAHYEEFDLEGRALVPLVKVYWPAE